MSNHLYDTLFAPQSANDAPFLIDIKGEARSYRAFLHRAAQFADAALSLGLRPGDRVAVQIDKSSDAVAVYVACVRVGLVFLPLNTGYTPEEVRYFLQDSAAALFLCGDAQEPRLTSIAAATGARLETLNADGTGRFAALADQMPGTAPIAARAPDDLAALLYTSGTTGRSKGAMLSHDNLTSNAAVLTDAWQFTADDVLLHALPIFHTHGLFVALNIAALAGCAVIMLPKFDVDAMIDRMGQITAMMGVPTFYTRLLDDARFDRALTQHMRLFISGSAPLLAETHLQFESRTGHRILERYGMTETNMNTSNPYAGDRRAGTVGMPLPGVALQITDADTGAELPTGDIGLIEVRGRNVFQGYWQMPEKTAEELRANGFFITGDLGRIDADGYVHIVGRSKDMIIAGGYNIYPKEIELLIDAFPGVGESAVIGVPHKDLGEAVVAVIVPATDNPPDLVALQAELAQKLARFKRPSGIYLTQALPRNTMGKVQKSLLRAEYGDVLKAI